MKNLIFAININAVLEDSTEIFNATGFIIDNKKVYKNKDNEILTGEKKIKQIKKQLICVSPVIYSFIIINIEDFK